MFRVTFTLHADQLGGALWFGGGIKTALQKTVDGGVCPSAILITGSCSLQLAFAHIASRVAPDAQTIDVAFEVR